MANYNTNSVFSASSAGVMPNTVDDLIFFEDISYDQKVIWDEFEGLIASGDYAGAQALAKSYGDLHGYFADLYNMMVNRIKAVQTFLNMNQNNINNGTAPFHEFVKPKIARYSSILEDNTQGIVWIGPADYFDTGAPVEPTINKLRIGPDPQSGQGITIIPDADGYITINGTTTLQGVYVLGQVETPEIIKSGDIWTYYSYYVSGRVQNRTSGVFRVGYTKTNSSVQDININTSTTANMHGNLIGINNGSSVRLELRTGYGETYEDLKVAFMICKASDVSPNQKYVPFRG